MKKQKVFSILLVILILLLSSVTIFAGSNSASIGGYYLTASCDTEGAFMTSVKPGTTSSGVAKIVYYSLDSMLREVNVPGYGALGTGYWSARYIKPSPVHRMVSGSVRGPYIDYWVTAYV